MLDLLRIRTSHPDGLYAQPAYVGCSPQLALEVEPFAVVFWPAGHLWQKGRGVVALPPGDHWPWGHGPQAYRTGTRLP